MKTYTVNFTFYNTRMEELVRSSETLMTSRDLLESMQGFAELVAQGLPKSFQANAYHADYDDPLIGKVEFLGSIPDSESPIDAQELFDIYMIETAQEPAGGYKN